jgi:hypothetical protein
VTNRLPALDERPVRRRLRQGHDSLLRHDVSRKLGTLEA